MKKEGFVDKSSSKPWESVADITTEGEGLRTKRPR